MKIGLLWLGLAAGIGVLLRYAQVWPMPDGFNYRFWLHAHSHVMLLGWLFNALFANLLAAFVPPDRQPRYRTLFWVLQAAVLGMLLTFPVQGYAAFSIAFSTLHMVAAYVFA
ncbi:MAG: hypothetical protein MUD08_16310, partial [Cytophagales bacterium]|nr:hypothetical protein [Cytophagales bacterium]